MSEEQGRLGLFVYGVPGGEGREGGGAGVTFPSRSLVPVGEVIPCTRGMV